MEYLFVQGKKDYGDGFNGLWGFPGGKQEEGESMEETVIREIKEELDLDVEVISLVHKGPGDVKGFYAFWFLVNLQNGEVNPDKNEIGDWAWLSKSEAMKLMIWPATIPVIENYL